MMIFMFVPAPGRLLATSLSTSCICLIWLERFGLRIETFETFGFQKWTWPRCIGIFIGFVGRCASGRSPGERSVLFVTTNGATIPALGFGTYGMPRSDMLANDPGSAERRGLPFRHGTNLSE
jgi:hypothetical protein